MTSITKIVAPIIIAGALFSTTSYADIIISGTRIVYDADKKTLAFVWKIKVHVLC